MRIPSSHSLKASALVPLLLVGACSADIAAPVAGVRGTSALRSAVAPGTSNSVRYKSTGAKPATGRSGSAAIELRALLGADGQTVVEATTGSLEAATTSGNIDKAQLKVLLPDGTAQTQNFNGLKAGGYWSRTIAARGRGDAIQVQTNVSGIDPKRTDVVTATTNVMRRPDVAVNAVRAQSTVAPHSHVTITADVAELNGDVGARGDCVLSIDGTVVDQAGGIWVDAGGVVSCAFDRTFDDVGTHDVTVSVTNVRPGDWSTANNAASTTVTVTAPGSAFMGGEIQAWDYDFTEDNRWDRTAPYEQHEQWHQNVRYSGAWMHGWSSGASVKDGVGTVTASIKVDGLEVAARSLTLWSNYRYDDGTWYQSCGNYSSMGDWASICVWGRHDDPSSAFTDAWFQHVSGTVTYYGSNYYCDYYGYCGTYTWNTTDVYSSGERYGFQPGQTITIDVAFTGVAGESMTASRSVLLENRDADLNRHDTGCNNDYYYGATVCWDYQRTGTFTYGYGRW